MDASPGGCWTSLRSRGRRGHQTAVAKFQYVLDLRAKLHTLGRLSRENLLQAQDRQTRLYNRGTRLRQFTPGDKVLVLLPTSSSKLLAKWQGPFCGHTASGGARLRGLNERIGVMPSDLSPQPAKRWNDGDVGGVSRGSFRTRRISDQRRPSNPIRSPWSPGEITSRRGNSPTWPSCKQLLRMCFHPCPVATNLVQHPHRNAPRGGGAPAVPIAFPNQEKCSSGGVKGHA